jgi:alkylation response protein AidB-like acyl-CoA dehydrogenase
VQKHLFEEECALAGAPRIVPFGPVMVAPVIMAFGTPEQQQRFLPGIASGEDWWSQGYSEPGSGSDLASVKTRAERQGDTTSSTARRPGPRWASTATWIFCLVRTSTEGKPQTGHQLPADRHEESPASPCARSSLLDGEHEVNEVFFDNVKVPAENLVGEENKGWTYAKHLLATSAPTSPTSTAPSASWSASSASPRPKACTTTRASATRSRCWKWTSWRWR